MIQFLHPWMLAGLAAAAVPVLLHLLARREPPTVVFPAVRYLITATREHQRRWKLQNWLLLLARALLIVLLVLAAAGPTVAMRGVPGHAPSALVLIVDNSASSGAVASGTPRLRQLQAAAHEVLSRATPEDVLWLIAADAIPRRGDRSSLAGLIDSLTVSTRRLDLGAAVTLAGDVLASDVRRGDARPGEIVLISDLQASALSSADPAAPLTVARPSDAPPTNIGIASLDPGPQPWASEGGRVTLTLAGDSGAAVPVSARLGDRPPRQALARAGGGATVSLAGAPSGWWTVRVELAPDEFRLDDERVAAVRVAPIARVRWDSTSRFVAAACEVLQANRRIASGNEVTVGRLGAGGASVVMPPADPAELGALNRALAARGVGWSFGSLSPDPSTLDSGAVVGRARVLRRYTLERSGSANGGGVLATAGGTPWIVRGGNVVLLGSRLDPAWTDLPTQAGFMPFMDALLNRLARGEVAVADGAPGAPVPLPDRTTAVRRDGREWPAEGGGQFRPADRGVYYLLADRDTIGAVTANVDPRESLLAPAADRQVAQLWRGARVVDLDKAAGFAFSAGSRGDLRGPLLWAALLLGLLEVGLASGISRPEKADRS